MPLDMIPGGRLPLTGGTLRLGTSRYVGFIGGSDDTGSHRLLFAASGFGQTRELVFQQQSPAGNDVNSLTTQNLSASGYTGINIRDNLGREKGAHCYGNLGATSLAGFSFYEAWSGYSIGTGFPEGRCDFTATISNGGGGSGTILNVTAVSGGAIVIVPGASGSTSFTVVAGSGVTAGNRILSQESGTPGGIGLYTVSIAQNLSSRSMGAGILAPRQQIERAFYNPHLGTTGANTREVGMEFDEIGYIKIGTAAFHNTYGWQWDPFGNVIQSLGDMTITTGSLAISAGSLTLPLGSIFVTAGGITVSNGSIAISAGGLTVGGNSSLATLGVSANVNMANGTVLNWSAGGPAIRRTADGITRHTNAANNTGANLDFTTADAVGLKNLANTAQAKMTTGPINYAADAGSTDDYAITLAPALLSYQAGQAIYFKAATANTGAATLNVNGLGAKTIVKAISTTLATNDILAGMYCHVVYDGTNFVLMNPRAL